MLRRIVLLSGVWLLAGIVAVAQAPAADGEAGPPPDLAKQSQNPVGDLISLPLVSTFNFDVGRHERTQFVQKIQPVYPMNLGDWNWIHRAIVPLINQPVGKSDEEFGLGDITYQGFLSPATPGRFIWGVGPIVTMPTAADDVLGSDKWSAGPAAVGLTMPGNWVIGALVSHQWSFAGEDDRDDVSVSSLQYFLNYNIPDSGGWYFTMSPTITANWEADSDDRWTVPFGGGIGRVFAIGKQPVNAALRTYYNVEKPNNAADWSIEFSLTLLFPKGK